MASNAVVSAKIRRPRVAPDAIDRPGPTKLLDQAPDHRVTLVTGPAGFGKSWLVSDWLDRHADWHQSWVTIDEYDSDPMRLWLHIVESLADGGASGAAELLDIGRSGIPVLVDAVAADLGRRSEPTVIVLDDVQRLSGDETLASVDQFLTELPDHTHVILIGRHEPVLPLAKRRLSADLLEIRTADLRCTLTETKQLISTTLGLALSPDVVEGLHDKSMGWIAGLRLGALAASRNSNTGRMVGDVPWIATFDGAFETLGDDFTEGVLNEFSDQDRQFLLDTSILHNMTGPLCDAVAERTDSAEVLERLARNGMFTGRTGEADGWYRYHDLFRDALTAILRRTAPRRHLKLQRRAAWWFRDHNDPVEAVNHALKAEETDLAAQWLVESSRSLLANHQNATLQTLFDQVEAASPKLRPAVAAARILPALFSDTPGEEINRVVDIGRTTLAAMTDEEATADAHLWGFIPYPFREDPDELIRSIEVIAARRSGDLNLALATLAAQGTEPSVSGWIEGATGELMIFHERYSEGTEMAQRWHDYAFLPINAILANQAYALIMQAYARRGTGDLTTAEGLANKARDLMSDNGFAEASQTALANVPLAWAAWDRGKIDLTESLITDVLERLDGLGDEPATILGRLALARALASRDATAESLRVLDQAAFTTAGGSVGGYWTDRIAFERVRLALLSGDVAGAEAALPDWRSRIGRDARTMSEHLVLAHLTIATGDDPTPLLDSPPDHLEVGPSHRIELHKLRAHLAIREGDTAVALDELTNAMKIASHTGHTQTFLDDAHVFGVLLDNAAARARHRLRPRSERAETFTYVRPEAKLVGQLTDREADVVRLLPSHLTYDGIGDALSISRNTVKAYVKTVYQKLDVTRRSEAVAKAKALGLID